MSSQPKKTPILKLYVPLAIALLPALFAGLMAALMDDTNCLVVNNTNCETYLPEFGIVCAVISLAILVSFFAFQRTIVMTVSVLTIPWNAYGFLSQFFVIYHANFLSLPMAVFASLPALVAAGIVIYRCLRPTTKRFWENWRLDT